MIADPKLLTAEDVWQINDDAPVELIRGELRETPAGGLRHGGIGSDVAVELGMYGRETKSRRVFTSETGGIISQSPTTLLVPDPKALLRFAEIAPDVVLEILSPSQRFADLIEKTGLYLKIGVPLFWLADPERRAITALTPDGSVRVYQSGKTLDGGDVLPGFSVPVDRLFP